MRHVPTPFRVTPFNGSLRAFFELALSSYEATISPRCLASCSTSGRDDTPTRNDQKRLTGHQPGFSPCRPDRPAGLQPLGLLLCAEAIRAELTAAIVGREAFRTPAEALGRTRGLLVRDSSRIRSRARHEGCSDDDSGDELFHGGHLVPPAQATRGPSVGTHRKGARSSLPSRGRCPWEGTRVRSTLICVVRLRVVLARRRVREAA